MKRNFSNHVKSKQEGVKFPCDQCVYKATKKGDLLKHNKSIHKGVKFPCNKCDYKTAWKGYLSKHIKARHEGISFPCDQCDYKTVWRGDFLKHLKTPLYLCFLLTLRDLEFGLGFRLVENTFFENSFIKPFGFVLCQKSCELGIWRKHYHYPVHSPASHTAHTWPGKLIFTRLPAKKGFYDLIKWTGAYKTW